MFFVIYLLHTQSCKYVITNIFVERTTDEIISLDASHLHISPFQTVLKLLLPLKAYL